MTRVSIGRQVIDVLGEPAARELLDAITRSDADPRSADREALRPR
jgi:hypothetical protein